VSGTAKYVTTLSLILVSNMLGTKKMMVPLALTAAILFGEEAIPAPGKMAITNTGM